ncbi:MAG: site-specific integrase [bacterium]
MRDPLSGLVRVRPLPVLTGARLGEAIAIQWSDLDLEVRAAEIRRNIVDGKETTPKSGTSRRVDLSGRLAAALRAHHARCAAAALDAGTGALAAVVIAGAGGKPMDSDNFRKRVWPKILAKAELRTIRIHDLRHTFASLLITQGESPVYVKDQLGHHSIRVTVDTYGHLVPGGNRAAVDRLNALLSGPRRTPAGPHTGRPESQAAQVRGLPSGADGS